MNRPYSQLALLLVALIIGGCQNTISGSGSSGADASDQDDDQDYFEINSFSCIPENSPSSQQTRRLQPEELRRIIPDLLGMKLNSTNKSYVLAQIQDELDALPVSITGIEGTYSTQDNTITDGLTRTYFDLAKALGSALAETTVPAGSGVSIREDFAGSCINAPDEACITQLIQSFGLFAFRRPVDTEARNFLLSVYEDAEAERKLSDLITSIFAHPQFTFVLNYTNQSDGDVFSLGPYELATKLALTFWASTPDSELLELAASGAILNDDTYRAQVNRVFSSSKTGYTINRFYDEWLRVNGPHKSALDVDLAEVQTLINHYGLQNPETFHEDANAEVQHLLRYYTWHAPVNERKFTSLFLSPYSFAQSADLAERVYGVAAWNGDYSKPVRFSDAANRQGFLTRTFTVMNEGAVTRPILIGKFMMDQILCQDIEISADTTPPAGLEIPENATTRLRTRMETQAEGSPCALCHASINEIGFSFENMDPLGGLRSQEFLFGDGDDAGEIEFIEPIDATSSVVLSGKRWSVRNGSDLSQKISQSYQAHACFVEQYWKYANRREFNEQLDGCSLQYLYENLASTGGSLPETLKSIAYHPHFKLVHRASGGD